LVTYTQDCLETLIHGLHHSYKLNVGLSFMICLQFIPFISHLSQPASLLLMSLFILHVSTCKAVNGFDSLFLHAPFYIIFFLKRRKKMVI